jgi:transposase-like protein
MANLPPVTNHSSNDDEQLLDMVASRAPAMRAAYATNLQSVNDYIRDAEESVKSDPNDEEAQQSLMAAYEQKAMVYEMALDRSLP